MASIEGKRGEEEGARSTTLPIWETSNLQLGLGHSRGGEERGGGGEGW